MKTGEAEGGQQVGPSMMATEGTIETLRAEVNKELDLEGENMALIKMQRQRAQRLAPLLFGLIILNVIMLVTFAYYGLTWIVASFLMYMYYFIVLLFPTTRKVRAPADKLAGRKAEPRTERIRGLRGVVMRGKKAVVIAFWNSFFIGTQTLTWGIVLIMTISIIFSVLGLLQGTLDWIATVVIIAQACAIMGYYYVIIRYRPYSKEFLQTVARVRRDRRVVFRWQAYLKGVFIVLLLLTVFGIFLVSAILLPKSSLDLILVHINQDNTLALLQLALVLVSQFVVIRYIQGFYSARIASQFIVEKEAFLKGDILSSLDDLPAEGQERQDKLSALRNRFLVSRLYKVAYKDIFGILPTYPIILDFKAVLDKDVANALGEEMPLDIPSGEKGTTG